MRETLRQTVNLCGLRQTGHMTLRVTLCSCRRWVPASGVKVQTNAAAFLYSVAGHLICIVCRLQRAVQSAARTPNLHSPITGNNIKLKWGSRSSSSTSESVLHWAGVQAEVLRSHRHLTSFKNALQPVVFTRDCHHQIPAHGPKLEEVCCKMLKFFQLFWHSSFLAYESLRLHSDSLNVKM